MEYLDFDLEIRQGVGRDYPIEVHSPAGEARETMRFPYDDLELENRLQALQIALLQSGGNRRQALTPELQKVQDFGQSLFSSILTGEVGRRYDSSLSRAELHDKGLRLRLIIQSPKLAALPWEFLYDSRQASFVSLSRNTPLVRYLELAQTVQPMIIKPPLHILGMIASPTDLPALNVEREKQRVEEAIKDLKEKKIVDIKWLKGQTWRDLSRAMRQEVKWHIFHFIGHGGFDTNQDEGLIALANEDGKKFLLSATKLGLLLANHKSLRLVLLNSCEGARSGERDIFSSTASILVRKGIPAVLAMQYEITDKAAIEFSRGFYEALADGQPVDAAVAEGRVSVSLEVANTIEWGTPVLYMRSPDGKLFNIKRIIEPPVDVKPPVVEVTEKAGDHYSKGLSYAEKGEHDKAIEEYTHAIELDPNKVEYYYSRGMSYTKNGKHDKAIEDYSRAIFLEPKADYFFERGESYCSKPDYDRAIANFNRAIEFDPDKANYYFERGKCYRWKGEYQRSIDDFSQAIQRDPSNADYYWERGTSYLTKKQNMEAIDDFNHAIEIDRSKAKYYYARGIGYANIGDHDKAIADYNDAIVRDDNQADYFFELGYSYAYKHNYDGAIENFNKAIELDKKRAEYYYSRCLIHASKGDHDKEAIEDFKTAIQLDPNRNNLLLLLHALRQR